MKIRKLHVKKYKEKLSQEKKSNHILFTNNIIFMLKKRRKKSCLLIISKNINLQNLNIPIFFFNFLFLVSSKTDLKETTHISCK